MQENYYHILGVTRDASEEEIKRSYRKLALQFHPDRNPDGDKSSESKFKDIVAAYHILSDKNRRIIYDFDLAKGVRKPRMAAATTQQKQPASTPSKAAEMPTNISVLKQLIRIRKQVEAIENRGAIKHPELFRAINTVLSSGNIQLLINAGDPKVSRRAIDEVLATSKLLSVEYLDRVTARLIKIAGADNEKILEIHQFNKQRKQKAMLQKYMPALAISAIIILMFILINLV
jgi:molecular chaperone DnaJ